MADDDRTVASFAEELGITEDVSEFEKLINFYIWINIIIFIDVFIKTFIFYIW